MESPSTDTIDDQQPKHPSPHVRPYESDKDLPLPGSDATAPSSSLSSDPADSVDFHHDTCRGWVPVGAAAASLFVYLGVIYSWGVLQMRLVETASASLTTLMFVGSLATSFMISISTLAGLAVRTLGYPATALLGAALMGLGEFLASWATAHVAALFVLHGLVFGVGGGLSIFACSTAHLQWFKKQRGLAMGVVFGGGSVGSAVMSVATHLMINRLGVAWTFRALGLMLWGVCIPASWFIRAPKTAGQANLNFQWFRFREAKFQAVVLATVLSTFSLFIPPYFIPIFSRSMGYTDRVTIITLAGWNVASTVGRVAAGFAADRLLGPLNSLLLCLLLMGLSSLVIWPFAYTINVFVVYIVFNGIGCGAFFSLVPATIGAVFGSENALSIIPMVWTTWFCGFFLGTPIASGLYSLGGSADGLERYRPAAFYAGAMSLVAFFIMTAVRRSQSSKLFTRA